MLVVFWMLLYWWVPSPLSSQVTNLDGRVLEDESEDPVEGTLVTLLTIDGDEIDRSVSDVDGRFTFAFEGRDRVRLLAERIGYRDSLTPILHLDGRLLFDVEIRMSTEAVLLAPLEVVAWSEPRSTALLDFNHRREVGLGSYITREVIEERDPPYVTDLLATVPGVRLLSSGRGNRRTVVMGRAADCPASIWVDGMLVNRGPAGAALSIDEVVAPESVYGIEVYRGGSTVPPDFLDEGACGVVAIWTRRSPRR